MEIRTARADEVDAALALVASYASGPPAQAVVALREAARRGEIDLDELTVAVERPEKVSGTFCAKHPPGRSGKRYLTPFPAEGARDRLLGATLAIIAPGRTAFLTVPGVARRRREREVAVALLTHWRAQAADRDLAMVQAFVTPGDRRHQRYLEAAGFERLADLIYLERDSAARTGEGPLPPGLAWRTYRDEAHDAFARLIAETYRETLDCPRLEGVRPIEDIVAGHKAQGQFDANWWFLLERGGATVGCLLLNAIPERESLDITYMGLVPAARRSGLGAALVQHAIDTTRRAGRRRLTCAVDADNLPAIKTYARFDFRPADTRRVFIALPQQPTDRRQDVP